MKEVVQDDSCDFIALSPHGVISSTCLAHQSHCEGREVPKHFSDLSPSRFLF